MKKRNRIRIGWLNIFLGSMIFLWACSQTIEPANRHESKTREHSMSIEKGIPPVDMAAPSLFETASFGLGWFWGIESRFGIIEGVIRTRVGYAGGEMSGPSYGEMGDHTETVQVDYDPQRITYSQLLEIFWNNHRPTSRNWSRQYMNAIFYQNDEQRRLAMDSKNAVEQKIDGTIRSEVLPLRSFTMAEDYHQKYILKQHTLLKNEMSHIYPRRQDFVASTAVSRLNGYAGGNGTRDQLSREIETLGLSDKGKQVLSKMVR